MTGSAKAEVCEDEHARLLASAERKLNWRVRITTGRSAARAGACQGPAGSSAAGAGRCRRPVAAPDIISDHVLLISSCRTPADPAGAGHAQHREPKGARHVA